MIDLAAHVQSWRDYLATVEVRGPIPIRFDVLQNALGVWILRSTMEVPNREDGTALDIMFQNKLPGPELSKRDVIVARVLQCYQHEALDEFVDGPKYIMQAIEEETAADERLVLWELLASALQVTERIRQAMERRDLRRP